MPGMEIFRTLKHSSEMPLCLGMSGLFFWAEIPIQGLHPSWSLQFCPQATHYELEGHPLVHVVSVHVTLAIWPSIGCQSHRGKPHTLRIDVLWFLECSEDGSPFNMDTIDPTDGLYHHTDHFWSQEGIYGHGDVIVNSLDVSGTVGSITNQVQGLCILMHKLATNHHHFQLAHSISLYHTVRAMQGITTWSTEFRVLHATTVPQFE